LDFLVPSKEDIKRSLNGKLLKEYGGFLVYKFKFKHNGIELKVSFMENKKLYQELIKSAKIIEKEGLGIYVVPLQYIIRKKAQKLVEYRDFNKWYIDLFDIIVALYESPYETKKGLSRYALEIYAMIKAVYDNLEKYIQILKREVKHFDEGYIRNAILTIGKQIKNYDKRVYSEFCILIRVY